MALLPYLDLENDEIEDCHLDNEIAVTEHTDIIQLHIVWTIIQFCQIDDIHDYGYQERYSRNDRNRLQAHFRYIFILAFLAGENAAENGDEQDYQQSELKCFARSNVVVDRPEDKYHHRNVIQDEDRQRHTLHPVRKKHLIHSYLILFLQMYIIIFKMSSIIYIFYFIPQMKGEG